MKLFERLKSLVQESKSKQVETIVISKKQCPHCVSRGLFIFNNSVSTETNVKKLKSETDVTLSLSKGDS